METPDEQKSNDSLKQVNNSRKKSLKEKSTDFLKPFNSSRKKSVKENSTDSLKQLSNTSKKTKDENSNDSLKPSSNPRKNSLNEKSVVSLKTLKDRKKSRAKSIFRKFNKVGPERPDAFQFYGQIDENDIAFHTYTPPLAHYEFYKGYEEFIELLKEYKAEGSDEKYAELHQTGLRKMKLELVHRFPWPPKISRNTFWTFGYYRDYYPEEMTRKQRKVEKSASSTSLDDPVSSDDYFQPKTAADYLDSTDVSTVQLNRNMDSFMNNYSDYIYDIFFKNQTEGTIPATAVPVIQDSISDVKKTTTTGKHAHIVLPSDATEDDETKTTMTKTNKTNIKGRRATAGLLSTNTSDADLTDSDVFESTIKQKKKEDKGRRTTTYSTHKNSLTTSDMETLDSIANEPVAPKKKKKKRKHRRTKIIYETTTYNPDGTISTETTEENTSVVLPQ